MFVYWDDFLFFFFVVGHQALPDAYKGGEIQMI